MSSIEKDSVGDLGLVGRSPAMEQIRATILQVAPTTIPVLILGESGSGKELVARAIHENSPRKKRPMITVNCGAIPEGILESELFGHQRGAFTGAVESRKGYFELADGGTLFLDEIGEMPLSTQVKVLRVLEEKEFMRVGGAVSQKVDVRILAATNRDLESAVREGEFRLDLYYRLNAVKITIPPLRERKEDIPLLIEKFTRDFCRENQIEFQGFTPDALKALEEYAWPGNVRELKNFVQTIIVLEKGRLIDRQTVYKYIGQQQGFDRNLPVPLNMPADKAERELIYRVLLELRSEVAQIKEFLMAQNMSARPAWPVAGESGHPLPVQEATVVHEKEDMLPSLEEAERDLIRRALEKTNWNKRRAARILKVSERTLYRKIKEYGIEKET